MRLHRYLMAILDICKLEMFSTGDEFQHFETCYYTPLHTYCLVTIQVADIHMSPPLRMLQ